MRTAFSNRISAPDTSREQTKTRDGAQSIRRTLELFEVLAGAPAAGLNLTEIADRARLSPPTARRMLKTLVEAGAAEQSAATRNYRMGPRVPVWAAARPTQVQLIDIAGPSLTTASRKIGVAAFLSYRTGLDATCLTSYSEIEPSARLVPTGARRPLGFPACSIAMLAELSEADAENVIKRNQNRLQSIGISVGDAYRSLQQARERGFAMRPQGAVTRSTTLSVAITPLAPAVLATITVSQPQERSTARWIDGAALFLHERADEISKTLASSMSFARS